MLTMKNNSYFSNMPSYAHYFLRWQSRLCFLGMELGKGRLKRGFTVYGGMLGAAGMSHLYWSSVINKRFNKMVDPYFAKYRIK